jgi:hypothetical protein
MLLHVLVLRAVGVDLGVVKWLRWVARCRQRGVSGSGSVYWLRLLLLLLLLLLLCRPLSQAFSPWYLLLLNQRRSPPLSFKFQTAVLSVLCVTFQVQVSCVVNLLNGCSTVLRSVVSFTPRPLYLLYPFRDPEEDEKYILLTGNWKWFLDYTNLSIVTVPTEISRFSMRITLDNGIYLGSGGSKIMTLFLCLYILIITSILPWRRERHVSSKHW